MTAVQTQEPESKDSGGHFSELLEIEAKLAIRTPIGIGTGIGLPVVLLVLFWLIGTLNPGTVGNTGLSVLELYVPTIMVIGFVGIAISALPAALTRYREIGWLRRVSTTPVHPSMILAAQLIINLVLALATILIVIFGSELLFGASLAVGIPYFILSIILSLSAIISLGLVVAALAPSQQTASGISGGLFFLLLFLAGLWIQPSQVGGLLATISTTHQLGQQTRPCFIRSLMSRRP